MLFGVVAFIWPGITLAALVLVWGAYAMVDGVLMFMQPGAGALAVVWLIASYAIFFGILLIALGFRLKGLTQRYPAV